MLTKGVPKSEQKKAFLQAMEKTFGNVSASCRAAGILSRQTPYNWAKRDPKFKKQFESSAYAEAYKDAVEAKLAKLGLQDENPTVLIFLAKTKLKDRGYVERAEVTGAGGTDLIPGIQIEIINSASQVTNDSDDENDQDTGSGESMERAD